MRRVEKKTELSEGARRKAFLVLVLFLVFLRVLSFMCLLLLPRTLIVLFHPYDS